MRFFTVKEAEALIGDLEEIFAKAVSLRDQAEKRASSLQAVEQAGSDPVRAAMERAQVQFLVNGVNECLGRIAALGGIPKGLDPALVDFPHRLGRKEVYLCWRLGEKRITHYHAVGEGFAGRQPLP